MRGLGRNMMIMLLVTIFCGVLAIPAGHIAAQPEQAEVSREQKLQALEEASGTLYQAMQDGEEVLARQALDTLTARLGSISYEGLTGVEGIHELSACIIDAKAQLYSVSPSLADWKQVSARLKLAINSLVHPKGAIWLQYYKVMSDDLNELSKAAVQQDKSAVKASFTKLQTHYELIRSAAVIRREPHEITAVDSWLSYLQNAGNAERPNFSQLQTALARGQGLLSTLFGKSKDEPVMLPITGYSNPWSWVVLIGIWILLALGYTAFRKYTAAQNVHPVIAPQKRPASKRTW